MKTLSATAEIARQRAHTASRYLMEIAFTAPSSLTLRVSDQPYDALIGQTWLPLVADWGTLEEALNRVDAGGRPATFEVSLVNNKAVDGTSKSRLSDLIRTPLNTSNTYEWAFATATVKQILDTSHGASDAITLGVFYLEDPVEIGEDVLVVRMSDQELVLNQKSPVTAITADTFPLSAPSVRGKRVPVAFGTLTNVPAMPVVAGVATALDEDLDTSETTITLTDASALPSSGTVMIDQEFIDYGGKSGNDLTSCTRAVDGTIAAAHDTGVAVYEVLEDYVFVVCENTPDSQYLTKSVTNIRVNGQPAQTSPTVDLDDTSIVSGRSFVTITFSPADVDLFHTISAGRNQTVSVSAVTVTGDGATYVASTTRTVSVSADSEASGRTTRKLAWNVSKGTAWATSNAFTINRQLPNGSAVQIAYLFGNGTQTEFSGTDTQEVAGTGDEQIFMTALIGSAQVATLTFNLYEVGYQDTGGGRATSTAEAVIGAVTCDVEGIKDDGSGTLSGTADLLLVNPADITKYILTELYGVASASIGSTLAASRTSLNSAGYEWAFLLGFDEVQFSDLRRQLGEQARSQLFLDGGTWQYKYLPDTPTADITLDYLKDVDARLPARVSRTPRTEIRNRLIVSSARDYAEDTYTRAATHEDLTQTGLTTPFEEPLALSFVQDEDTATALGDFWLDRWKRQRFEVELDGFWNLVALEKGDHVAIDNHPVLANHGDTSLIFEVRGKRYYAGEGRIGLTLREAGETP